MASLNMNDTTGADNVMRDVEHGRRRRIHTELGSMEAINISWVDGKGNIEQNSRFAADVQIRESFLVHERAFVEGREQSLEPEGGNLQFVNCAFINN